MEVKIETRQDHVHVLASGTFSLQEGYGVIAGIAEACRAAGLDRVLLDGRGISTQVAVMHRYDLAKALAEKAQSRLRMAVVVSRDNMFSKTLEETAQNLGVDVHTTESMAEALAFLELQA